jgi:hypothetical protein
VRVAEEPDVGNLQVRFCEGQRSVPYGQNSVAPPVSKEGGNREYKACLKEVFRCLLDMRKTKIAIA